MKPSRSLWWLLLFSVAYGLLMIALDGRPLSQGYELSPYHRYQADALLRGQFALGDSLSTLQPGLVWQNGHVQHVWGLGVAYWLMPFEMIWRFFGGHVFPDRFALGVAFALLAFFAGGTALRLSKNGQTNLGLGVLWLVLLCPAIWTLAHATRLVFEETVLFAILLSLGVLVSMVRVVMFGSKSDYALCYILSALLVWVRPTHAIYGLLGVLVSSVIVWTRKRSAIEVAAGLGCWFASLALLAWTNEVRFGSPTEFGHQLTVSTGDMVYLTRFGNPFQTVPAAGALKELFGLLFLALPTGAPAFAENLFPWQASGDRWRRLDLSAYDFSFPIICIVAVIVVMKSLVQRKRRNAFWQSPQVLLAYSFAIWSALSIGALTWFYLYYPAMASRYLLDFSPGFAGFVLAGWAVLPARMGRFCLPLLGVWLVYQIAKARVPMDEGRGGLQAQTVRCLMSNRQASLSPFNGCYTPERHPAESGIACNGQGWETRTGFGANVVVLAVDRPEFIELRLSDRRSFYGQPTRKDVYQAMIDGCRLSLESVCEEGEHVIVRFSIPKYLKSRAGDEMLFLCFSGGFDSEERASERFLYQVRWR